MTTEVDAWFDATSDQQKPLLKDLRRIVKEAGPSLVESIKWGRPCYNGRHLVCYLKEARDHVTIGFQQGAHLQDKQHVLEGEGKDMRHVKVPLGGKVDEVVIRHLVEQAVKRDR